VVQYTIHINEVAYMVLQAVVVHSSSQDPQGSNFCKWGRWVRDKPTMYWCGGRVLTSQLNWPSDSRRLCPAPPEDGPELGWGTAMTLMMTLAARRTAVKNNFMFDACSVCLVSSIVRRLDAEKARWLTILRWGVYTLVFESWIGCFYSFLHNPFTILKTKQICL